MTKNRTIAPEVAPLREIEIVIPERIIGANGLPILVMSGVPNDVFHIQLEFGGGKMNQNKPLVSSFCADLLFSGTKDFNQLEIQEQLDLLGVFVNCDSGLNKTQINIYGLVNNAEKALDIVEHVLESASFPEKIFDQHRKSALQKHSINLEKNSYVAQREFLQALYPQSAPGKLAESEDFELIKAQDCKSFYNAFIKNRLEQVIVIGNMKSSTLSYLDTLFAKRHGVLEPVEDIPIIHNPKTLSVDKPDAVQSALRIGFVLFTPKHADYFEFDVLETILGGYFGSRLMQNLREDKGYTYGIGSGVTLFDQTGYFFISAEVGKGFKQEAMDAIQLEINRLRDEPIGEEELQLARSYIQGQLLKSSDGPFAMMNQYLFASRFDLPHDHLSQFLQMLEKITPEKLQELAIKYLNWDNMSKIVVG